MQTLIHNERVLCFSCTEEHYENLGLRNLLRANPERNRLNTILNRHIEDVPASYPLTDSSVPHP